MNFSKSIKWFKKNPKAKWGIQGDHTVIRVKSDTGDHFYAFKNDEEHGAGNYGAVYKGYYIDPTSGEKVIKPYAVKIFYDDPKQHDRIKRNVQQEAKHLKSLYFTETPQKIADKFIVVTEFHPGKTLTQARDEGSLKGLTLLQRLALIRQIVQTLNLMHHQTPYSGRPLVHVDIKPDNIIVDLPSNDGEEEGGNEEEEKENKTKVSASIVDFGFAEEMREDNLRTVMIIVRRRGTIGYIAMESYNDCLYGTKSDIYPLTAIAAYILGATDPLHDKNNGRTSGLMLTSSEIGCAYLDDLNNQYHLDGILDTNVPGVEGFPQTIKELVTNFLGRMQSREYRRRPDTDEVFLICRGIQSGY